MKSYAKINIFLKITGKINNYHQLSSRFIKLDNLYDEIYMLPKKDLLKYKEKSLYEIPFFSKKSEQIMKPIKHFEKDKIMNKYYYINENLLSNFYSESNIFDKVLNNIPEKIKLDFLTNYAIILHKNIPTFAGLGGASSNAASFIKLLLKLGNFDKFEIAKKTGADVSFFISDCKAANVSGYGEIINEFKDCDCNFNIYFSEPCSTQKVFYEFSKNPIYYESDDLKNLNTIELLKHSNYFLNDLLLPCEKIYQKVKELAKLGFFMSGSGGSFFTIKH
ncbi:4-(cytidine 5'-diphospho)-2-C-methyl-D-erythritol kinase [Campylobacter sp. MG1]|uniref:GHMP family kinase ATP-binding protein n=1 Tax=Campylobacter sp. MG1 TaxID=2976332 RepID=UPI00226C7471|nr:4-(cytidine 5'-diphospho)-2-C-methyl-D-erythritol kinase [Campylobacter sp. MG1]